jgi:hypothetical protein
VSSYVSHAFVWVVVLVSAYSYPALHLGMLSAPPFTQYRRSSLGSIFVALHGGDYTATDVSGQPSPLRPLTGYVVIVMFTKLNDLFDITLWQEGHLERY